MAAVMFAIAFTISKLFADKKCITFDYDRENGTRSKVNMPIESPCMTCYMTAFVILRCLSSFSTYSLLQCA